MNELETDCNFEHDDFEDTFESCSSHDDDDDDDNGSCEPERQENFDSSEDPPAITPSSSSSRPIVSPAENMSTDSWTSPSVPRTVRARFPDSAASVISDVSGMTELNMMAMSLQAEQDLSTRIQPRDHRASCLPRDQSIANNYQNDTTYERPQYAGDVGTIPPRSGALPSLPTHLEQEYENSSEGIEIHVTEIGPVVNAHCEVISEEEYQAAVANSNAMVAAAVQPVLVHPAGGNQNPSGSASPHHFAPPASSGHASAVSATPIEMHGSSSSNMDASSASHEPLVASTSSSRGKTKVIRTTIKKIPAKDKPRKKVVRKTTTIASDGSTVEKIENADGTTTTMIKRTTKRSKESKSSGESDSNAASSNVSMNSSTTSSNTSRQEVGGGPPAASRTTSKSSNESSANKKVKRRTTKQSADGSRVEVIEYTDGSKVTETFTARKKSI